LQNGNGKRGLMYVMTEKPASGFFPASGPALPKKYRKGFQQIL